MTTNPHPPPQDQELRSVYTTSLAEIFAQLTLSLVVSTYQAGKVILVRYDGPPAAHNGHGNGHTGALNTHFHAFQRPMDIAVQGNRLAIGGQKSVWGLRNVPAVARKPEPPGTCRQFTLRLTDGTDHIVLFEFEYAALTPRQCRSLRQWGAAGRPSRSPAWRAILRKESA